MLKKIWNISWFSFRIVLIVYAVLIFSSITFSIVIPYVISPFTRTRIYQDCSQINPKLEKFGKTVDVICLDSEMGKKIHEKCFLEK